MSSSLGKQIEGIFRIENAFFFRIKLFSTCGGFCELCENKKNRNTMTLLVERMRFRLMIKA